jgi:hypothetical protein
MDLRRPPDVPRWFVVPAGVTRVFAFIFTAWAAWKWLDAITPRMCGGPTALQGLAVLMAMIEGAVGIALAFGGPTVRAWSSLIATGLMTGLIGFSLVAQHRGISAHQCFCFGGFDLAWTTHATVAAGLALVFFSILLDHERRFRLARETGPRLFPSRTLAPSVT